ncbi:MAG: TIM-barrel domain-containing protein [Bacteroidales bacterium]
MKSLILTASVLLFTMCSQTSWDKKDNMVIVRFKPNKSEARLLKLEVINDEIIHVVASPSNDFSTEKSLCVIDPVLTPPDFDVRQENEVLVVSTGKIKARVSLATGRITFLDRDDKVLLKEPLERARSFTPVTIEGTAGYSIGQVFESPAGEAFYGLGQHQSEEFNYKGLNESLYQYNTKVSVPFIVSNKNYGILWDNYSLTKFGDPRNYSQMNLFTLYDDNGEEGGLTATYYINSDTNRIFLKRKEQSIDYEDLKTIKDFPEKFPFNSSTITWTGKIEPRESGLFFFRLYYAGYTKLYINNELVVPERWRTAWNPNTYKFSKNLEKGHKYSIKLEWKPDGGVSYIGLKALSPRTPEDQGSLKLTSEMGNQIDYYFVHENNMDGVISGYRTLTGKASIMPKWALGYWQSRERYRSQTELLDVVKEYRKRNIPIDNIVLDWSYWPVESWGSHEFDPKFFPDPTGMVNEVHKLNAKIMISVWPKFYVTTEHYREFDSKGWMYRQAVKDSVRDWIGRGYIGSFYDPYSQESRDLFWNQIWEHLYPKGFDAWWMDASEPDILSNASIEYRKALSTPTAMGPSTKYFNTYALMNAMAIYEGQRSVEPNKRVFLLTRSGFAGLQRYSTATWSGDIGTRWEDMKAQIPAGLNFALSGIPYWTFDIGGFCVENRYTSAKVESEDLNEWRELNTRWFQFGSFCPLFRSHGQYPFREIYNISPAGSPAYQSMVYYDRLRYRLMPYIYSLAGLAYFNDYTLMRAMVMDFGVDKEVLSLGDQYMFGPSILVAPVYKYRARSREVYFPASAGWYDLYSGDYIFGGHKLIVDAPYERIPLFVKEGSIIPVGPEIQYTDEKTGDPISLFVYSGRNCSFTLYEDEGTNYNYEKGACSTIKFSFDNASGELTIGDRNGEYNGMVKTRTFNVIWIDKDHPLPFDPEIKPHASVTYDGKRIVVSRLN